jgi:hypothetical protein
MKCEIERLTGNPCSNSADANITISGDKGSVTIGVCLDHLGQLSQQMPTNLGTEAQRQLESWKERA